VVNTPVEPRATAPNDPPIELLIPVDDVADPEVSIVVPALNEHLTIVDFVRWCREGLTRAGVRGEILIIDSSTDDTAELALAEGARVLRTPKRGLGRAYIDAVAYIRGQFVIMGDADCTYDFRELGAFVEQFHAGYEFVMGTRFKGYIEPGSMPALHRYLGTPVTTWILNRLYSSRFSDIHCGMRGITKDALVRMHLESQSWEYASEMVLKSVHLRLRTTEVPVRFLKDREGRVSHHRRLGWFSPWQAAWINLRAMFIYGADFFVFKPGIAMMAIGLLITLPLTFGAITIGPITFSLYWSLAGVTLTVLGFQCVYLGCLAQTFYDPTSASRDHWLRVFRYNRSVLASTVLFAVGVVMAGALAVRYVIDGFSFEDGIGDLGYIAITGVMFVILAFMNFSFTLLLHASALRWPRDPEENGR
jgi:glycosyltransferase involved in cell wall biosynthesis